MNETISKIVEADFEAILASAYEPIRWFYISERMTEWAEQGVRIPEILDYMLGLVAVRYHQSRLSYQDADGLANDLHSATLLAFFEEFGEGWSADGNDALWVRVYLAFDSGEFSRGDGLDPVVTYTQPQIELIVAEILENGGVGALLQAAVP